MHTDIKHEVTGRSGFNDLRWPWTGQWRSCNYWPWGETLHFTGEQPRRASRDQSSRAVGAGQRMATSWGDRDVGMGGGGRQWPLAWLIPNSVITVTPINLGPHGTAVKTNDTTLHEHIWTTTRLAVASYRLCNAVIMIHHYRIYPAHHHTHRCYVIQMRLETMKGSANVQLHNKQLQTS